MTRWLTANKAQDTCGCAWELRQPIYPGARAEWIPVAVCAIHAEPDEAPAPDPLAGTKP